MRIMVAGNDPATLTFLEERLSQWGYEVLKTGDGAEAYSILTAEDAPEFAVMEWGPEDVDGLQICRMYRALPNRPYIYMIILTEERPKEELLSCLEAGADEYMIKPLDSRELLLRLRAGNRVVSLIGTLTSVLKLSEHEAAHDPLTGLWNRAAIVNILRKELARAARDASSVGVIAAGLDGLTGVAKDFGELTSDSVMREILLRIHSSVRSYDSVGRLGEDEFIVIAPGCDVETSRSLSERLRKSVSAYRAKIGEREARLLVSVGVVTTDAASPGEASSIIESAEKALARARASGEGLVDMPNTTGEEA